jgi:hypothetical protein
MFYSSAPSAITSGFVDTIYLNRYRSLFATPPMLNPVTEIVVGAFERELAIYGY